MNLAHMDQESRSQLLAGNTIVLVLHYSGNTIHHARQILAAQNNVCPFTFEKLCEQAGNAGRGFSSIRVEIPEKALVAASQDFAGLAPDAIYPQENGLKTSSHNVDLGQLLPGYAMHVLTWYCRMLGSASGNDFLPADPFVQECDKFFWLYSYVAMRKLGMHCIAKSLGNSLLGTLVEKHQLVDELWMLDFVLENLTSGDPLFRFVAKRYIVLENSTKSPLSFEQWMVIIFTYPHFTNLVAEYQEALREMSELDKAMKMASIRTERLEAGDGDVDRMEE